jgi:glycine hydroxymethyltransferase
MVADVLEGLRKNGEQGDAQIEANVRERVSALCHRFPIYPEA